MAVVHRTLAPKEDMLLDEVELSKTSAVRL